MRFPRSLRRGIANLFGKLPFSFKGKNYVIRAGKDLEERYIGNAYIFGSKEIYKIMKNPSKRNTPQNILKPIYDRVKDKDDITKMQYVDIHTWLWGDILNKADTMSMAHSLEVRVPFLDKEVAKVAYSIP